MPDPKTILTIASTVAKVGAKIVSSQTSGANPVNETIYQSYKLLRLAHDRMSLIEEMSLKMLRSLFAFSEQIDTSIRRGNIEDREDKLRAILINQSIAMNNYNGTEVEYITITKENLQDIQTELSALGTRSSDGFDHALFVASAYFEIVMRLQSGDPLGLIADFTENRKKAIEGLISGWIEPTTATLQSDVDVRMADLIATVGLVDKASEFDKSIDYVDQSRSTHLTNSKINIWNTYLITHRLSVTSVAGIRLVSLSRDGKMHHIQGFQRMVGKGDPDYSHWVPEPQEFYEDLFSNQVDDWHRSFETLEGKAGSRFVGRIRGSSTHYKTVSTKIDQINSVFSQIFILNDIKSRCQTSVEDLASISVQIRAGNAAFTVPQVHSMTSSSIDDLRLLDGAVRFGDLQISEMMVEEVHEKARLTLQSADDSISESMTNKLEDDRLKKLAGSLQTVSDLLKMAASEVSKSKKPAPQGPPAAE